MGAGAVAACVGGHGPLLPAKAPPRPPSARHSALHHPAQLRSFLLSHRNTNMRTATSSSPHIDCTSPSGFSAQNHVQFHYHGVCTMRHPARDATMGRVFHRHCPSCALLSTHLGDVNSRGRIALRVTRVSVEDSSSPPYYSVVLESGRQPSCSSPQSLDAPDTAILFLSDRILVACHSSIRTRFTNNPLP
jgi:hypothetical protein